jgi:hypothetical protein
MRKTLSASIALVGLLLAVSPMRAHHAFAAEYDAKKQVRLEGVVTQMEWINPHAWIHIDVTGPDGKVTSWMVEGYQAKNGENRANGANITFKDGKRLFLGGSNPDERPQ